MLGRYKRILQSAKRNVLQRASGTQAVGKQYPFLVQAFIAMSYCTGSKGHERYKRRPSPMQAFISMSYCAGSKGHKRSSGHEPYPSPIQASLSCFASSKGTPERTRCPNKYHVNIWEYCKLLLKVHVFRARRIGERQSVAELR